MARTGLVRRRAAGRSRELRQQRRSDGWCDAIYFITESSDVPPSAKDELAAFRKEKLNLPAVPAQTEPYDLVVIGGGIAGMCASVAAARSGCRVALGTRVMRTTGMMGGVVGLAASLGKKYGTTPRGVYRNHLAELKERMQKGAGKTDVPDNQRFNESRFLEKPRGLVNR